jgi:predicted Zn-dependent protease
MGFGHSNQRVAVEAGIILGVLGALAVVLWNGAVWAAGALLTVLPYSVDQQVGDLASNVFTAGKTQCTNPRLIEAVEGLVAPYRAVLPEGQREFKVTVLDDDMVNAFALPGGQLFVMTGLLKGARSSSEVAGVLGHEIGHAVLRHSMRALLRQAGLWTATLVLLGGLDRVVDLLAQGALQLGGLAFGREQEAAADAFAVDLALRAKVDVTRLPDFFARAAEEAGGMEPPAWLSTHPAHEDRVEAIRTALAAAPVRNPTVAPLLEALQLPCQPEGAAGSDGNAAAGGSGTDGGAGSEAGDSGVGSGN